MVEQEQPTDAEAIWSKDGEGFTWADKECPNLRLMFLHNGLHRI